MNPAHRRAIDRLIDEHEGGFVDHPADKGGATKYGVAFLTLRDWRGAPTSKDDVRNLTRKEASEIYEAKYIKEPNLDLLEEEWLFAAAFDQCVNFGPKTGVILLQRALCVLEDGILGPITARVANGFDENDLRWAIVRERQLYRASRVQEDRSQADFIVGWTKRDFDVLARV